jgi:riboflavin kinase/FMN adenylyltransferase
MTKSAPPPSEPQVFAGSTAYSRRPGAGTASVRPVLTIGNFDGVHLGHRALLQEVVAAARARGVPACVYTFDPPPRQVLAPSQAQARITPWPDRVRLLGEQGVDHVIIERFTHAFAQHPPGWFVDEVLGRRIHPVEIIVGYDFRFGRARAGTLQTVAEHLPDVPIRAVDALEQGDTTVSSSEIRRRIASGDVEGAAELLDRPHRIRGVVVPGDQRGRTIGFPTANLDCTNEFVPAPGVYAVRARIDDGPPLPAVANLGVRPTFGSNGPLRMEVHLIDWSGDIYGSEVEVDFMAHIRGEKRFSGLDALTAQIRADVETARVLLNPTRTPGA